MARKATISNIHRQTYLSSEFEVAHINVDTGPVAGDSCAILFTGVGLIDSEIEVFLSEFKRNPNRVRPSTSISMEAARLAAGFGHLLCQQRYVETILDCEDERAYGWFAYCRAIDLIELSRVTSSLVVDIGPKRNVCYITRFDADDVGKAPRVSWSWDCDSSTANFGRFDSWRPLANEFVVHGFGSHRYQAGGQKVTFSLDGS